MTQEDKEFLLKDLCARLPYGVKVNFIETNLYTKQIGDLLDICISTETEISWYDLDSYYNLIPKTEKYCILENIKPYLRPMSSMTEEEKEEYRNIDNLSYSCPIDYAHIPASDRIDWLNKKMFDYRGLIPMGIALEAPKGMYK